MRPLFILPFDHRGSFARDLLGAAYPVSAEEKEKLVAFKEVIFDGLLYARTRYTGNGVIAKIIDEEFGTPVIKKAKLRNVPIALTVVSSAHDTLHFVHGEAFQAPLVELQPAFAKALIYYEVGNNATGAPIRARLKQLNNVCREIALPFMLEVLITNHGPKSQFTGAMIDEMTANGIQPNIWKIEALETEE